MKTNRILKSAIAFHETYEEGADGKRQFVAYTSDGKNVKRIPESKLQSFIESLKRGSVIRPTAINAGNKTLLDLDERGIKIEHVHWHDTGIQEGLPPEEIVQAYASLPDSQFREFHPNKQIAELRQWVNLRHTLTKFKVAAVNAVLQEIRNGKMTKKEAVALPQFKTAFEVIDQISDSFHMVDESDVETDLDPYINKLAAKIPQCVLLKKIIGITGDSYIIPATIVAILGDIDRFYSVSAVWKYMSHDVFEGRRPKREKGKLFSRSLRGKTAMVLMGEMTFMKNRKNPWRSVYEQERAKEYAGHDAKCLGAKDKEGRCKTKDGHCTARARGKVCKEIIKRFFLAVKGQKFQKNHNPLNR